MAGRSVILVSVLAGGLVLGLSACGESPNDAGTDAPLSTTARDSTPAQDQPPDGTLASEPSALARKLFDPPLLDEYRRAGEELGVSWAILAAADHVEGGPSRDSSPTRTADRILAIAYTLQALNAPADYEFALTERGGERYARRVLTLSQRLRSVEGSAQPAAELPFAAPASGTVIAGYGQRFGVLHDGIDIDAATDSPLHAAGAGLVISTGNHPIFGLHTCVAHRITRDRVQELTTCYGNQSRALVEPGDVVEAGELIGRVGCTGTCLRPHVHFQVRQGSDGTAPTVDPAPYLAPELRAEAEASGRPLEAQP